VLEFEALISQHDDDDDDDDDDNTMIHNITSTNSPKLATSWGNNYLSSKKQDTSLQELVKNKAQSYNKY